MIWRGQFYIHVDLTLPFGLCSTPFIFNKYPTCYITLTISLPLALLVTSMRRKSQHHHHHLLSLQLQQTCRSSHVAYCPWNWIGLHSANSWAKIACTKGLDPILAPAPLVWHAGIGISHWPPAPCCHSGMAWQNLPQQDDWFIVLLLKKRLPNSP